MSHEEEVARNAYAKFSFLCAVEAVSNLAQAQDVGKSVDQHDLTSLLDKAVPIFTLTNFEVGTVTSIASRPWGDFVTPESSSTLKMATGSSWRYYDDNGARVTWDGEHASLKPADKGLAPAEWLAMAGSVSHAIRKASPFWSGTDNQVKYITYAVFTVDVTLDGKSTGPHKAIYLFGTDSHGKEYVAENDLISGSVDGMWRVLVAPSYPEGFLRSPLRETPVVMTWVRENEMPAASCDATKHDVCCSHGGCGISQADLNRDLSAPLPTAKGNQ